MFFDQLNGLKLSPLGLFSTTDGGINWFPRLESRGRRGFYAMRFVSLQKGWIVGAQSVGNEHLAPGISSDKPLILMTGDGGQTWKEIVVDLKFKSSEASFSAFLSICANPLGTVWIIGNAGIIEGTIDSNVLRIDKVTSTNEELRDVTCDDSGNVWAVGAGGLIMHYQQGRWLSIRYPDNNAFFSRVKIIKDNAWVVGGVSTREVVDPKGLLLKINNGRDWENKTPPASELLFDVAFNGSEGWLVGARGMIYHTFNDGAAWRKETTPTQNDLFYILLSGNRGWIGGDKMTLLGLNIQ
jgi:photosystem II stability/assembly factor-like uncharacterized protein